MPPDVMVADYGMGNVGSVLRALAACGASPKLTADPAEIAGAPRLILPGVGAFADGMEELRRRELIEPIRACAHSGRPFLGICLGMQMMFTTGEEFGVVPGLALLEGSVLAIPRDGRKVPHIGWNRLLPTAPNGHWHGTILDGLGPEPSVYFVHSYAAQPADAARLLAECYYDGCRLTAAVRAGNLYGCQFHPEKSGPTGLRILRKFLSLEVEWS